MYAAGDKPMEVLNRALFFCVGRQIRGDQSDHGMAFILAVGLS